MSRLACFLSFAALAMSAVLVPTLVWADDKGDAAASVKPADLVGVYTITSGEREGVPEPPERIKGTMVRFSEDRLVVIDKQDKELYGADYKLDPRHKPAKITMTSKLGQNEGSVARGLIEKHGETVRLIYALPGGDEPASFKTKAKQLMFVMTYKGK